ncbi:MAG: tRNA 2-thiouridine(34) synthase MnmA [Dehalococcoidales bacterium]|nr:tRNA 2-thiouridine(34) synthase MnmA [Dehalococcoidales bacterium]
MRVAVALSGGVDSSVAAALLKGAAHEVLAVTMRIAENTRAESEAAEVARRLGIPHHIFDLRQEFSPIISYFLREYASGRTPNPCVFCNARVKFGILMERALQLGADIFATGHYARVERDAATGRYILKKGLDRRKDQSYFLVMLTQQQLGRTVFPLGSMTKDEVRAIARRMDLPAVERTESREICFIPDNDHVRFLKNHLSFVPGPVLDRSGNVIGEHRGIPAYTIGQRRGLGLASAGPLYVTAIRPERNAIIVGDKKGTYSRALIAGELNWIAIPPPQRPLRARARVRYRHPEDEAVVIPQDGSTVRVEFARPQMAVTPGQVIAFYDGDTVLGGGIILERTGDEA